MIPRLCLADGFDMFPTLLVTDSAALFLKQFVDEKVQWMHIDLAGPVWNEKKHVSTSCLKVSSSYSNAMRELAKSVQTMKKSSTIDLLVSEMNIAVQELENDLVSVSHLLNGSTVRENRTLNTAPITEFIPVVPLASILTEISGEIEATYSSFALIYI